MTALQKITKRAKQIRKAKPMMKYVDAQRQAAAELTKPTKKLKKKSVSGLRVVAGVRTLKSVKAVKKSVTKSVSSFEAGMKILAKIDIMERMLKSAKGADRKNFIKREINTMHDKLDQLKARR